MQRYFSSIKEDNKLILNSDDMYHIKVVMRSHNGDKIEVVYDNTLHICKLENDDIIIETIIPNKISKTKHYTLCIPLLQEQKMNESIKEEYLKQLKQLNLLKVFSYCL